MFLALFYVCNVNSRTKINKSLSKASSDKINTHRIVESNTASIRRERERSISHWNISFDLIVFISISAMTTTAAPDGSATGRTSKREEESILNQRFCVFLGMANVKSVTEPSRCQLFNGSDDIRREAEETLMKI